MAPTRRADPIVNAFRSTERRDVHLWLVVLGVMVADVALTMYGLSAGLVERNPIALFGIEAVGYAVLAYLKVPAIVLGLAGWVFLSECARRLNLIGLAIPWAAASVINLWLIVGTT